MLTNRTPEAHRWAVEQFRKFRSEGQFVPLSVGKDTIVFPGFDGGAEWGGPALDPATGILYVNANEMAWTASLAENTGNASSGRGIYQSQCSACHGDNMAGSPPQFPPSSASRDRMGPKEIAATITEGQRPNAGFHQLDRRAALRGRRIRDERREQGTAEFRARRRRK